MGSSGIEKSPDASVVVDRATPVAWFVATTGAFGIAAPVWSSTVPTSEPRKLWPYRGRIVEADKCQDDDEIDH